MEKDRVKKYCIICGYKLSESGDCQHCKYINSIPNDVSGAFSYVMRNASSDIEDLLIEEVLDKAKKLFLSKLFTVLIVVGLGTNAAIVTYNTIKENVIENKIDELIEIYNQGENKDIYNYSLNINTTNENKTLATIEIPNYSIKDNITIDLYMGYDINDYVQADEGVIIDSTLDESASKLSINLSKENWNKTIIKDDKIIDSNPYPMLYKIINEHGEDPYTENIVGWGNKVLIMNDKNHGKIEENGLADEFTLDSNNNYSGIYHANYQGYAPTFTVTFDGDYATVFVPKFIQNGANLIIEFKKAD